MHIDNYKKVATSTASPYSLVKQLYESLEACLDGAHQALKVNDPKSAHKSIDKSLSILGILQEGLNKNIGGDLPKNLDDLYDYMKVTLIQANSQKDLRLIENVSATLKPIKSAWDEIPPESQNIKSQI